MFCMNLVNVQDVINDYLCEIIKSSVMPTGYVNGLKFGVEIG